MKDSKKPAFPADSGTQTRFSTPEPASGTPDTPPENVFPSAQDTPPENPSAVPEDSGAEDMEKYMPDYTALAAGYDSFMPDADYPARVRHLEELFERQNIPVKNVLDLGCGTGTVAWMLAQRGFHVIAADASPEMLTQAMGKAARYPGFSPPLFILQQMQKLDLGSRRVDAAVSTIDALNYLTRSRDLRETFRRVYRYLKPGGLFAFDVNTAYKFRLMDGQMYMDETADYFCVWRTTYLERSAICSYAVDFFRRCPDGLWERHPEMHRERAWSMEELSGFLTETGFVNVHCTGDLTDRPPAEDEIRWIFTAQKP